VESDDDPSEYEEEPVEKKPLPSRKSLSRAGSASEACSSTSLEVHQSQASSLPVVPVANPVLPPELSRFSSMQQLVSFQGNSSVTATPPFTDATSPADAAVNTAGVNAGILQLLLSTAYDTATLNARQQEMQRREWENEQKRYQQQAEDSKSLFMSLAAKAMNQFYHEPR
jgi:hypothetical protein